MNNNLKGSIMLFLTALLWGTTFIAQKVATSYVGPFTFIFFRSIIAVVLLYFISLITEKKIKVEEGMKKNKVLMFACFAGLSLFVALLFQQIGLETITASKSGFICSMYIMFVPLIGLLLKQKIKSYVWVCIFVAIVGSYLLSTTSNLGSFGFGELISLASALFFALQILFVDKACKYLNPYKFCMIQIAIVTVFSFIMMLIIEKPSIESIKQALLYMAYAGVFSSCLAYSFQIIGQNYAEPTIASIIMSLESVISLIAGVIILHETMGDREIIGSILIFLSVICSQIPFENIKLKLKK